MVSAMDEANWLYDRPKWQANIRFKMRVEDKNHISEEAQARQR